MTLIPVFNVLDPNCVAENKYKTAQTIDEEPASMSPTIRMQAFDSLILYVLYICTYVFTYLDLKKAKGRERMQRGQKELCE